MTMRSWLMVAGENEEALHAAASSGADAVIVDLTTPTSMSTRDTARRLACEWLEIHRRQILEHRRVGRWVRINSLDTRLWREDLQAVMIAAPDGIVLPRSAGPEHVQQLGAELYEL
jgi:citrate lyase subunit beta / citryl-CoA lyase